MNVSECVYTDYVEAMKHAEELMATVRGIYPPIDTNESREPRLL